MEIFFGNLVLKEKTNKSTKLQFFDTRVYVFEVITQILGKVIY